MGDISEFEKAAAAVDLKIKKVNRDSGKVTLGFDTDLAIKKLDQQIETIQKSSKLDVQLGFKKEAYEKQFKAAAEELKKIDPYSVFDKKNPENYAKKIAKVFDEYMNTGDDALIDKLELRFGKMINLLIDKVGSKMSDKDIAKMLGKDAGQAFLRGQYDEDAEFKNIVSKQQYDKLLKRANDYKENYLRFVAAEKAMMESPEAFVGGELSKQQAEMENLVAELEEYKAKLKEVNALEEENVKLKTQLDEATKAKNDMGEVYKENESLRSDLKEQKTLVTSKQAELESMSSQLATAEQESGKLAENLAKAEGELSQTKTELTDVSSKLEKAEQDIKASAEAYAQVSGEAYEAKKETEELKKQNQELAQEANKATDAYKELEGHVEQVEAEKRLYQENLTQMMSENESYQSELAKAESDLKEANDSLSKQNEELEAAKANAKELEEENKRISDSAEEAVAAYKKLEENLEEVKQSEKEAREWAEIFEDEAKFKGEDLSKTREELEALQKEFKEAQEEAYALHVKIQELTDERNVYEARAQEHFEKGLSLEVEGEKKDEEIEALKKEIESKTSKYNEEIASLTSQKTAIEERLKESLEQIKEKAAALEEVANAEKKVQNAKAESVEANDKLVASEKEVASAQEQENNAVDETAIKRKKLNSIISGSYSEDLKNQARGMLESGNIDNAFDLWNSRDSYRIKGDLKVTELSEKISNALSDEALLTDDMKKSLEEMSERLKAGNVTAGEYQEMNNRFKDINASINNQYREITRQSQMAKKMAEAEEEAEMKLKEQLSEIVSGAYSRDYKLAAKDYLENKKTNVDPYLLLEGKDNYALAGEMKVSNLRARATRLLQESGISESSRISLNSVMDQLSEKDINISQYKEIAGNINNINASMVAAGETGKTVFSQIGQRLQDMNTKLIAQYLSWQDMIRYMRTAINTVIELDSAITELRKVSDASTSRLEQSFATSANTAEELGSSITDVINATADWSRLGYDVDQAEELARIATLYVNVGDNINMDDANQSLISTLQGFKIQADDAESIVDKFNEVANNYAIDSGGIGQALQRSAASFNAANTSLSESIALVTATNEVVQNPEKVGNMWKTVSARIRGATAELEDMGEDTEGVVTSTSKLQGLVKGITGFDIMQDEDNFKSIYDIVVGIGEKWNELTDIQQAALLEPLAGKVQSNALAAALNNVDQLKAAYKTAEESAGSAQREQENYQKSIQYSIDVAIAKLQELATKMLSSKALKSVVSFGTDAIGVVSDLIDKFGLLQIAITAIGTIAFSSKFKPLISGLTETKITLDDIQTKFKGAKASMQEFENFISEINFREFDDISEIEVDEMLKKMPLGYSDNKQLAAYLKKNGKDKDEIFNMITANDLGNSNKYNFISGIKEYNDLLGSKGKNTAMAFAEALGNQNARLSQFILNADGASVSLGGYIKNVAAAGAKTLALNVASGLASAGISMIVGAIVGVAMSAFDNWIHRVEHAKEALEEMHDSYKETADKIKDQKDLAKTVKDEYFELAKSVDTFNNRNLDLSDSDYEHFIDLNNQLAEMFPTLKSGIDDEGNAILNLGNNADVASDKLQKLIDKNEEQARNKISAGLNEEFENTYTSLIEGDAYNRLQDNRKRLSDIDNYIARAKALGTNDQLEALYDASHQIKGKEPFAEVLQSMMNEGTYEEMIKRINTASGNNPIRTALSEYTDQEVKNFLKAFNDELNTKQQNTQSDILAGDSEVDATLSAFGDHLVQVAKGTNSYMQLQDDKLRSLADYLLMNVSVDDMKKIQNEDKGDPHVFIQRTVDLISGKSDEQQQKVIAAFGALQNTLNSSAELTLDEMYTQISDAINEIGKTLYGEKFTPEIAADLRKQFGVQGIYDTISTRDRIIAQGSGQDFGSAKASSFNTTRDFNAGALQNVMNNLEINSDSELAKFSAALLDDTNKSLDSVVAAYKKAIDGANSSTKEAETDVLSFKEAWEGLDDVSEEDAGIFKRFSFNKDQIKDLSTFKEKVNELAQSGQLSVKAFKGLDGADEFIKAIGVSATEATDKINKMIEPVIQLSGMRTGITSITSAYDEKKDDPNKIVGADTLNSMYSGLGISEWGKKDLEVWERYKKAATDSSMSMKEFKKYQDDLATSYVNSGNFLANLTEENKDYYTALLTEMGVANATEVVENKLNAAYRAQAEAKKKINNVDLKKNAEGDIEGLTGLRNESHNVRAALLELWEQKNNVFSTPLKTQESIDNLIALGREVGATAANLVYLNSLKRLQSGEIKGLGTEQINAIEQGAERAKKRILKNFEDETRLRTKTKVTTNGGNQNDKNKEKKSSTNTKATSTQIDWIEKKLTRLQGVISLTQAKLQNLFDVKTKNNNLEKQINQNEKLLKSYSVAASKYSTKANRAVSKLAGGKSSGLESEVRRRYNTGELSSKTPLSKLIKSYGEKNAKRIQDYIDYMDKANNAKIGVQNTKKAIRDDKIDQKTNISNYEQQVIAAKEAEKANKQSAKDRNKILKDERIHIRKNYNAQIKAAELENDSYKVKELTEQKQKALLDNTIEQNTNLQQEADAYVAMYQAQQQNAKTSRTKNALVDKEIAKTKESYKYQIKIAELQGDSEKKAQLEAERDSKIVSLNKQRLDNTINYYSNLKKEATNAYTDIGNAINVITAKGLIAGEKLYKSQQAQNDARLKLLADEKKEAEENQKRIQKGTQEWYDSLDAIQALDDEIANLTTDNINLEKSIRAVKTAVMDLANANIDTLKAENELMLKYLSYGDMVKDGGYTAEGLATLEQTYENAEYARKQLENVQNRMREYLAKKGKPYELLSGNERQEYDDLWKKELQYQNEYYDNMTKIADLEKQRLESYKNYLKELIDKRKQLLQAQKDEYDYEKTIAEKTQSIAILQKQIQSLNNDTSESANSRIQELQVQLDDANKDLRETEYNQWLSDQQSMLDGLYAEFESLLEKLEMDRSQLIKDAMTTVDQNTSVVASTLEKYMGENPEYTFSDYFKSVVGDETNGLQGINNNIIANTDAILRSAQGEVKDSATVAKSASDAQKVANNATNSGTTSKTTTPYDVAAQVIKDINSSAIVGKKITMKKDFKAYESPEKKAFSGYTAKKGKNYYVIETGKTDLGNTWLGLSKKHNSLDPKDLIGWVPKSYVKGYAKGGVVETLKRMPLANNDDAWITVGQGERILTPSQNAAFEKLMNNIDVLKPALAKNKPQVGTIDTSTTNIGDINLELNLPNVKNYDELVREMQRDSKFETLIKNIVIDKSSMSKYNVRW